MTQRNNRTLHQRILEDIQNNIISGGWPPGHRLPFEIELAAQYGCSRMTVNKVMTQLVSAGMIERRRRSGSFVRIPQSQAAVLAINEISTEVASLGLPYNWQILSQKHRTSNKNDRLRLRLQAAMPVLDLSCLHLAGKQPFCLEERLINLASVPQAATADFATRPPGNWLIDMVPWSAASNKISAIAACSHIAAVLKIPENSACLLVERHTSNKGDSVTSVRLVYPAGRHAIVANFEPLAENSRPALAIKKSA